MNNVCCDKRGKKERLEIFKSYLTIREKAKILLKSANKELTSVNREIFTLWSTEKSSTIYSKLLDRKFNLAKRIKILEDFMAREQNPIVVFCTLSRTR